MTPAMSYPTKRLSHNLCRQPRELPATRPTRTRSATHSSSSPRAGQGLKGPASEGTQPLPRGSLPLPSPALGLCHPSRTPLQGTWGPASVCPLGASGDNHRTSGSEGLTVAVPSSPFSSHVSVVMGGFYRLNVCPPKTFFCLFGPHHLRHMGVPRPGVKSEL